MASGIILRTAPDQDLYVWWSTVCDAPRAVGTRAQMAEALWNEWDREHPDAVPRTGSGPASRLARAYATGTSDHGGDGAWDDTGFVYNQQGWLPRARLGDMADAWLRGDEAGIVALLEPFEDDEDGDA